MTEVTIDPETGLPELEEGFYWKVTEQYFAGRDVLQVGIYTTVHRSSTDTKKRIVPGTWRNWFRKTIESYEVVEMYTEEICKRVAGLYESKNLARSEDDKIDKMVEDGWSFIVQDGNTTKMVLHYEPTPENLLKTAIKVYGWWVVDQKRKLEEMARNEKRNALLGAYPPKSLKVDG